MSTAACRTTAAGWAVAAARGIANRHWQNVGIGDGFWTFSDPTDRDVVYSEYQGGKLLRVNKKTLETKQIEPFARAASEVSLQLEHADPSVATRPGVMYVGAQLCCARTIAATPGRGSRRI